MRGSRRTRVLLILLLLTAVTLITIDYRAGSSSPLAGLRNALGDVFGPVERGITDVVHPIGDWFAGLAHLGSYRSQANRLAQENGQLRTELRSDQAWRRELADLQGLVGLAGQEGYAIVTARVVAVGGALGFDWTATIDKGSAQGIRRYQTVIDGDGLVGKVVAVSADSATVQLAVDNGFYAGARLASGQVGYVQGDGLNRLTFTVLDPQAPMQPGDALVTFGSEGDSPFVPDVPIGSITTVQFPQGAVTRTATVRCYVDFGSLDVVGVVVAVPRGGPRQVLLPTPPPSPTPSPSTSPAGSPTPSP